MQKAKLLTLILFFFASLFTTSIFAADTSLKAAAIAPVDDAWRAALPKDPVAATEAYMARLSPEARARSDAYFEGGYWLQLWNFLIGMLIAWLLLSKRWSQKMRDFSERFTRFRFVHNMIYAAQYLLASWVISLPLTIYQGFFREHQYGMATQTFGPWFGEQLISLAISLVAISLLLAGIYAFIRRAPNSWWAWGSAVSIVFMIIGMLIGPVYIDPLFNTYKPVPDGPIKESVLSMARANNVPADNVYVFDASRQTTRVSANVSGIFGTAAVRLNDNLLNRTSPPEIKGVMGHELGHYVLNHIYKMLIAFTLIIVVGFLFVKNTFAWAQKRFGANWGIRDVTDAAGMPLFAALFSVYMLAMTPIINTMIRVDEVEADIFGLNTAREGDGFAEVDLKLTEYRKADPSDVEEFIFYDHPSPKKRILAAMRWKAENLK
jgi:STE24 endopeptidase